MTVHREHRRLGVYAPVLERRPAGLGRFISETTQPLLSEDPVFFAQHADAAWVGDDRVVVPSVAGTALRSAPGRRATRLAWLTGPVRGDVRRERLSVLYCPGQEGPLVRTDAAVCLVVHDLIGLKVDTGRHRLDLAQLRHLLPRMIAVAQRVVTVSQSTRRDVLELTGTDEDKVVVIPPAVDHGVFSPRSRREVRLTLARLGLPDAYFLYAGTLSTHKNLLVVLDALQGLRGRTGGHVPLVVAGRSAPKDVERFGAEVAARGLTGSVLHVGYTSDDDLASLMSGARAFVFPSLYEGFGLAPLEAMACGAPVIASRAASLPEVVDEAGILLDPRDPEGWAAAFVRLEEDPAQRDDLRERSICRAGLFRWSVTNERIKSVLDGLSV